MRLTYPYTRQRQKSTCVRIEVMADSMRVGKSTAVKVLADGLRQRGQSVTESYEDWEHNPYLKGSYADPEKNFLDSQKWFIWRKHQQIADGVGAPLHPPGRVTLGARQVRDGAESGVFIQDVSPEMDYCYAATNFRLGRMSKNHFDEYVEYYSKLDWSKAPAPDLLLYLEISDDELIRRALSSKREFETVEPEYFLMMKRVNREWVRGVKKNSEYRIVNIDTDKIDFANSEEGRRSLVETVGTALKLI